MLTRRTLLAASIVASVLAADGLAQDRPLHKFSYHEGFEGAAPPVALWAHNGQATVNFLGPTDERASEGKRSLKLDVTLQSGSYHYWGFALRVPCAGRLKLSARMKVAPGNTAHVGFGCNFVFPPTHHSGCGSIDSYSKPTGEWKQIECDLVARGQQSAAVGADRDPADGAAPQPDAAHHARAGRPGRGGQRFVDDSRGEGRRRGGVGRQP